MRPRRIRSLTGALLLLGCGGGSTGTPSRTETAAPPPPSAQAPDQIQSSTLRTIDEPATASTPARRLTLRRVLVFSATAGFRHDSISDGVAMLRELGEQEGFSIDATESAAVFSHDVLKDFQVVVFLNTTGDVLNSDQQAALEWFVRRGGGWVGVHAAADTEYDWPFYGDLLGNAAWFRSHPPGTSPATLRVDPAQAAHPAVANLPLSFTWEDEWYAFRSNPGEVSRVQLRLDESSYDATTASMGSDHPISWSHKVGAGRAWYTGVGHRAAIYQDEAYRAHVLGGISWAFGQG